MYYPNTRLFGNLDEREFLKCYDIVNEDISKKSENYGLTLCTGMFFQAADQGSNPD